MYDFTLYMILFILSEKCIMELFYNHTLWMQKTALQLKVLYKSKQKVLPLDLYSTFHCNAVSAIQPNVQYINLIKRSVKYNTAEIMC